MCILARPHFPSRAREKKKGEIEYRKNEKKEKVFADSRLKWEARIDRRL